MSREDVSLSAWQRRFCREVLKRGRQGHVVAPFGYGPSMPIPRGAADLKEKGLIEVKAHKAFPTKRLVAFADAGGLAKEDE